MVGLNTEMWSQRWKFKTNATTVSDTQKPVFNPARFLLTRGNSFSPPGVSRSRSRGLHSIPTCTSVVPTTDPSPPRATKSPSKNSEEDSPAKGTTSMWNILCVICEWYPHWAHAAAAAANASLWWRLGIGRRPIFKRHNAFQWTSKLPLSLTLDVGTRLVTKKNFCCHDTKVFIYC